MEACSSHSTRTERFKHSRWVLAGDIVGVRERRCVYIVINKTVMACSSGKGRSLTSSVFNAGWKRRNQTPIKRKKKKKKKASITLERVTPKAGFRYPFPKTKPCLCITIQLNNRKQWFDDRRNQKPSQWASQGHINSRGGPKVEFVHLCLVSHCHALRSGGSRGLPWDF